MQVLLENIAFNHDPDLSKTGSFFLRRNETQVVPIPEWNNNCSSDPACAPAAYVIAALPATLTIKASVVCDDTSLDSIHMQAVESPAGSTHILGSVQAIRVSLIKGKSGLVAFQLPDARTRITNAGVSVGNIAWQWQFSTDGQNWTDFQKTQHRIYTVIGMPQKPWKPTSNAQTDIHVPWTEVLDQSCKWAAEAKDVDTAAARITRNMYQLGQNKLVKYVDGAACYARDKKFDCTRFLQLLTQGFGNGQAVNCEDCATVVSTFSNVLGAKLFQSTMGVHINTHPILLIGHDDWHSTTFGIHEVAWKNNCDVNDPLFDACLQVDGDGHPEVGDLNHKALQPTNLVFGTGQFNSYKFCLFRSGQCDPIGPKQRRRLGSGPFGFPKINNLSFLNDLKQRYEFHNWPHRPEGHVRHKDAFDGWEKISVRRFAEENFSNVIETLFKRRGSSQEFVEITVYEAGSAEQPNEFLLQLLGHFEVLNFTRLQQPIVGDVSFIAPGNSAVLFRRRNFVAAIRSVGISQTQVDEMAVALDLSLHDFDQ
jgi:hypothetical protein